MNIDDFTVQMLSMQTWPDYAIRMLRIQKVKWNEPKCLRFESWNNLKLRKYTSIISRFVFFLCSKIDQTFLFSSIFLIFILTLVSVNIYVLIIIGEWKTRMLQLLGTILCVRVRMKEVLVVAWQWKIRLWLYSSLNKLEIFFYSHLVRGCTDTK